MSRLFVNAVHEIGSDRAMVAYTVSGLQMRLHYTNLFLRLRSHTFASVRANNKTREIPLMKLHWH